MREQLRVPPVATHIMRAIRVTREDVVVVVVAADGPGDVEIVFRGEEAAVGRGKVVEIAGEVEQWE